MSVPTIKQAKELASQHNLRRCVILFELDDGQVGYTSYGETKTLCTDTRRMMDGMFGDIESHIHEASDRIINGK